MYEKQLKTEEKTCVIFDLDGTLLDTSPGIVESVQYALQRLGYPALSRQELLRFIGPPLQDSFQRCCGCGRAEADALTAEFRAHYRAGALLHAEPYDGIPALCEALHRQGFLLTVATGKPQDFSERLVRHFRLHRFFTAVFGTDPEGRLKKPELILLCANAVGADASQCVMVGDTEHDAKGAQLAGVPFLAVSYGFGDSGEMLRYPRIGAADTPRDILRILTEREDAGHV